MSAFETGLFLFAMGVVTALFIVISILDANKLKAMKKQHKQDEDNYLDKPRKNK